MLTFPSHSSVGVGGGARWSGGAKVLGKLLVPGRLDYLFGLK